MAGLIVPRVEPPEADAVIGASVAYFDCLKARGWRVQDCVCEAEEWEMAVAEYEAVVEVIAERGLR